MIKILAVGEVINGNPKKATKEITSIGKALAGNIDTIVFGTNVVNSVSEVAKHGADYIYTVESNEYNAEAYTKTIVKIAKEKNYSIILIPHTWTGRDISSRIATLLETGVISDATEIKMEGENVIIKKPVYSGKAFVSLKLKTKNQVVTVRPNSQSITENPGTGKTESITLDTSNCKVKQISFTPKVSNRVSLTEADIVVCAGRGIKGPENFSLIESVADILEAGVGATRAVVDAHWCDHTLQIGQTGQTVSPNLYIAFGISGAIQHMAGMGSSKFIVSINKDADAPIFKTSTYSVIDDLFTIIPPFKEELKTMLDK